MKQPATWKFLVAAVLLIGLGGGVTYWAQSAKLKRDWAARVPERPAQIATGLDQILALEARIESGDTAALADLATTYESIGAFAPALQAWETLIQLEPRQGDWWLSAATLQAAAGESRVAKQRLEQARELGFTDGASYWRMGQLAEGLGEQIEAKADYWQTVELDPQWVPAWLRLLAMHRAIGDDREARRIFSEALAANPDAVELLMDRAQRFRDRGNWRQAVVDFERVLELQPELAPAQYATAQAYFQLGRIEEGNALLTARLAAFPDDTVALMLLCVEALANDDQPATDAWLARLREIPAFAPQDEARLRAVYVERFGEPPPSD
jgi:tetratricopeptide (TPR) repeat protein